MIFIAACIKREKDDLIFPRLYGDYNNSNNKHFMMLSSVFLLKSLVLQVLITSYTIYKIIVKKIEQSPKMKHSIIKIEEEDLKQFYERLVKSTDIAVNRCTDPNYDSTHK